MTAQALSVTSQNLGNDGIVMLTVAGPLDSHTYNTLESKLDRLIHHGDARIIIDLAGVDYLSTAGVRVFLTARAKARHENGSVVLLSLSEQATQVVDTLQIRENLNIARDLPDAMEMVNRPAA